MSLPGADAADAEGGDDAPSHLGPVGVALLAAGGTVAAALAAATDRVTRPVVIRGNTWYVRDTLTGGVADRVFTYGQPGDFQLMGDWDGNGTDTPGVVRGSTWYLKNTNASPGTADVSFAYGFASDLAVAGDWDGDGVSTPGVVRGTTWYLRATNDPANTTTLPPFAYGQAGDQRVVGDWNGDGTTTIGVKRRSRWLLRNSNQAGAPGLDFPYGLGCDLGFASPGSRTRDRGGKGLPAALRGRELTVLDTGSNVVALTFDAGANADAVPSILATLERNCVPATFFLTGRWVELFGDQARQIGVRYQIGNHSQTHPHLPALSDAAVRDQITTAERRIQGATKYAPRPMFRFPFGDSDARTLGIVNGLRYGSIRWTVDTLGWMGTSGGQSVQTVVNRVLANLRPGEIVLMHVGSHPTDGSTLDADALPTIIAELRQRGYGFVTIYDSI